MYACVFLHGSNLFIPIGNSQFKPVLEVMKLSLMNSAHLFDSKQISRWNLILFYVNFKFGGLSLIWCLNRIFFLTYQTDARYSSRVPDKFQQCSPAYVEFHSRDKSKVMQIIKKLKSKLPNCHYSATVSQDTSNYCIVLI